jgi:hypothetical protein
LKGDELLRAFDSWVPQPKKMAKNLENRDREVILLGKPDQCPRCHRSIEPIFIHATIMEGLNRSQVNWRCPSPQCQELFIANYSSNHPNSPQFQFTLTDIEPRKGQRKSWPDCIETLSPMFIAIYDQAIEAEAMNLDQLLGMGLRKALEFLITDYVISQHPMETEKIYKIFLGERINKYITDPRIKDCAKRAVWLGNDETHIIKKWEAMDIKDLKRLIRLTVNYIDSELTSKEYTASMPENKN